MTVTIDLPKATLARLQAEAQAIGKDLNTFVTETLEAKLTGSQARDRQPLFDAALVEMAADPQMRRELVQIEQEFYPSRRFSAGSQ